MNFIETLSKLSLSEFLTLSFQYFGLIAAVFVAWIYARQLQTMRRQADVMMEQALTMNSQRQAMDRQLEAMRDQLKVGRELSVRERHVELLSLAIHDEDISKVWRYTPNGDIEFGTFKRNLFVNLFLSHLETTLELGIASVDSVRAHLREDFTNPHFMLFWEHAAEHRKEMSETNDRSSRGIEFHRMCQEAYDSAKAAVRSEP